MQKECVIIVIINTDVQKNLGIANIKNFMLLDYVKIVI
jgi:hypothetical protein